MTKVAFAASGVGYDDVATIIEQIAESKARQAGQIAYYDFEDLKQEVRLKCFTSLRSYDPSRSRAKITMFLSVCADNRIKDIRRSVIYKHGCPCYRCQYWDEEASASGLYDCVRFTAKTMCPKMRRHTQYVHSKMSINSPGFLDEHRLPDANYSRNTDRVDLFDFVQQSLPSGLLAPFLRLQESNYHLQSLSPTDRGKLTRALRDIFRNLNDG